MKSAVALQMIRSTQMASLQDVLLRYGVFVIPRDAEGREMRMTLGSEWQMITEPIRDYQTYPAAGYVARGYFNAAAGATGTTPANQNMPDAGKMPRGQMFFWEGIEADFVPAGLPVTVETAAAGVSAFANDMWKVYHGAGYLDIAINNRPYLNAGPLCQFPPSFRMNGAVAAASETTAVSATPLVSMQLPFAQGNTFEFVPLLLEEAVAFQVTVRFDAAVAVSADGKLGLNMNGVKFRRNQ